MVRCKAFLTRVKDLIAVANHPTTWGAKPFAEQVFDFNATVVDRLNREKAILIGKLSMVELAGGGGYSSASASLQGPGLNPWNKQYWSGGSSSGSGAAVAAGLVPYALGSETSGSIMTPACFCGISGLRPTYGLVSRHGAMPLSWTLDKIGVLARSAEDCGLVLRAIAGGDDSDPGSAHKSFYYAPQFYQKLSDLKLGYAEIDFAEWPDEPLRPAFANALSVVKSIGSQMVEAKLPDFPYGPVNRCNYRFGRGIGFRAAYPERPRRSACGSESNRRAESFPDLLGNRLFESHARAHSDSIRISRSVCEHRRSACRSDAF